MSKRFPAITVALLTGTVLMTVTFATQIAADAADAPHPPTISSTATTATMATTPSTQAAPPPWATLEQKNGGYRYTAGLHDSHLIVTRVAGGLRFVDTATVDLRSYPAVCRQQIVRVGIAAVCRVPASVTARNPMTIELAPRLGDDFVDASTLSAEFEASVRADTGRDVVRTGAGDDFINGALDRDKVSGGEGDDWIRTGPGNDAIWAGAGSDRLAGVEGHDTIHGGDGNDRLGGGSGNDRLYAGGDTDHVLCGAGQDEAHVDRADNATSDCESVGVE